MVYFKLLFEVAQKDFQNRTYLLIFLIHGYGNQR